MIFCKRCGCDDPKYFVYVNGQDQCRRCISYQGQEGESHVINQDVTQAFKFQLTLMQKELSEKIYDASHIGNVLVHAVCGAGKSELIVHTISNYLSQHKKVGITIARRQVVLELQKRYQAIYPNLKVIAVCEGYTQDLKGDLIICTAHQLYRFHKQFDCLIIDEPDAYPYHSDLVLQGFAKQACIGVQILLTATPDESNRLMSRTEIQLFRRPHQYDLPLPRLRNYPLLIQILWIHHYIRIEKRPTLIFVPSIQLGKWLHLLLHIPFVYANHPQLDPLIQQFKQNEFTHLLTTTVLERGVTFDNVQVIVCEAQHRVFNKASLVQIAGRVGRHFNFPTGEVNFLCSKKTELLFEAIDHIKKANSA